MVKTTIKAETVLLFHHLLRNRLLTIEQVSTILYFEITAQYMKSASHGQFWFIKTLEIIKYGTKASKFEALLTNMKHC